MVEEVGHCFCLLPSWRSTRFSITSRWIEWDLRKTLARAYRRTRAVIEKTTSLPSSLKRLSPLKEPARTSIPLSQEVADSVQLALTTEKTSTAAAWPRLFALGLSAFGAALSVAPMQAQVMQVPASALAANHQAATRFLQVALGRGLEAPRGQALEVIREYAKTDFGQEMIGKVLADFDSALQQGWVNAHGDLTEEGEFTGYTPFRIVHSDGSAQASLRRIELPERFGEHFFGSGLPVFPLAIVHHEFGHTQFGQPPRSEDILTDHNGSRLRVEHEMEIVERFENPVRLRYGYEARTSYRNHLGECAGLCDP